MKNIIILLSILFLFSCQSTTDNKNNSISKTKSTLAKVEVYYLHQTNKCKTCIAIGKLANKFVADYNNKNVAYHELNISLKENQSIADKFQTTWSGLYILSHNSKGEVIDNLTELAFMYAINNPDTVNNVLKSKVSNYLKQ